MKKEITLHPLQGKILKALILRKNAKFSQLNKKMASSDHFSFHIKSLLEAGLIEKASSGGYSLTTIGKEFANRLDIEQKNPKPEKQAKIGALVVPIKKEGGETFYLLQKRLKHPYFGFIGFLSGKVKIGETIFITAKRELKEEAGLKAKTLSLAGVKHKMDYNPKNQLLEDKFFFVIKAEKLSVKLKQRFAGGQNFWQKEKDISKLPCLFPDVLETIKMAKAKTISFSEKQYKTKNF